MKVLNEAESSERDKNLAINQLIAGRSNAGITVTLTPGATSTTVACRNGNANAAVIACPLTANAAAALTTLYFPSATITGGSFVIQHAANAQADRTFRLIVVGG